MEPKERSGILRMMNMINCKFISIILFRQIFHYVNGSIVLFFSVSDDEQLLSGMKK